jgi:DNA-binding IscR family transcriptional regulator
MSVDPRPFTSCIPVPRHWHGKLPANELAVAIALLYHANDQWEAQPSIKALAAASGVSASTVKRCLSALRFRGVVSVEQRRTEDGGNNSNLYRINLWALYDQQEEKA